MITATWTWTDIRNFEEDPSSYQRAQLAWALVLAVADSRGRFAWLTTMKRKDEWLANVDRKALLECLLGEWSKQRDEKRRGRKPAIQEPLRLSAHRAASS
jgi:hypothetical protein